MSRGLASHRFFVALALAPALSMLVARHADAAEPLSAVAPPPAGVVPVPTPSPEVRGGAPVESDTAAPRLDWKWQRFSTFDYVVTLTGGALTLTAAIAQPQPKHAVGPILFDDAARDLLRARGVQQRYTFRDASDVGLSLAATWPFFVDSLFTAWWLRGSRDVAEEMALIDLETLAISGAVQGTTDVLVSRERPYGASCGGPTLPSNAIDCDGSTHYRSFFSGHAAFSFTSAALICVQHFKHDLLGGPWDALSCAGGYAVAATTATFRVVGDVHYASDVLTGALVGSLVGYGIPLLHYARGDLGAIHTGSMTLQLVPSAGGAGIVGIF